MANLGLASEDLLWFYMSVKIAVFQLCSEAHQTTSSSIHRLFLRDKIFFSCKQIIFLVFFFLECT